MTDPAETSDDLYALLDEQAREAVPQVVGPPAFGLQATVTGPPPALEPSAQRGCGTRKRFLLGLPASGQGGSGRDGERECPHGGPSRSSGTSPS